METRLKQSPVRVLLLSLKSEFLDDDRVYPPLGLLYLKSYVNAHVPEAIVEVDCDYFLEDAYFAPYDIIGLSILTPQREEAKRVLDFVKERFPQKKVIAGGVHITHYWMEELKEEWDFLVRGDGEKPLVRIIRREECTRMLLEPLSREEVLNAPRPDRTSESAKKLLAKYSYSLMGKKAATILTARGCPNNCAFCEEARTIVRHSRIENLKLEFEDIKRLGYEALYFYDDTFTLSAGQVRQTLEGMGVGNFPFRCMAHSRYFLREGESMAKTLTEFGCVEVAFGIESGCQRILDFIGKNTTVEENLLAIRMAKKHGMIVKGYILLGLPGENEESLADTERFLSLAGLDDFQAAVFMPFRGTRIRDALEAKQKVDLFMVVQHESGAFGIKGGETAYEVRTKALNAEKIREFRNRIVRLYRPASHKKAWS
jgi:radical SAM superfamily enzyme YgiQ (UPF0313 family)